jgi:hypothetical protein
MLVGRFHDEEDLPVYQSLTAQLPASWLATRVGANTAEIDRLRQSGELFATRPDGSDEWLYSAWQFGPGGRVPEAVRRAVRLAVEKGLGEEGLLRVLRRRVGLTGSERMVDLLFQGDGRSVISAIHAAA